MSDEINNINNDDEIKEVINSDADMQEHTSSIIREDIIQEISENTNIEDNEGEKKLKNSKEKKTLLSWLVILLVSFTFGFTIFYIPYETLATNTISMEFPLDAAVKVLLVVGVIAFVISFAILALVRGLAKKIIMSILVGFTFCIYIQSTFMNSGIGTLTGDKVDWSSMTLWAIINLLIWIVIIVAIFIVLFVVPKAWKTVVSILCVMLIIMQLTGFIGVAFSSDNKESTKVEYVLSDENLVKCAKKKNIFIFCLDRLDYSYLQEVQKKEPEFFNKFGGFHFYDNATSGFYRTIPGANYLLSNYKETAYEEPLDKYLEHSWNSDDKHILKDLKEAGYKIDIYDKLKVMFGDASAHTDEVDNLIAINENVNIKRLLKNVGKLTMYRVMPLLLKPYFWMNTTDVNKGVVEIANEYDEDETVFDDQLGDMNTSLDSKCIKFYHFCGSHAPYRLDKDGHITSKENTNATIQTMGSFSIVYRAIEKMKELGIYEDATIIITGDHGKINYDSKPLDEAERLGLLYKASGETGNSITYSNAPVGQDNIPATILKEAGLDYSSYGLPLDEVNDENTPIRYTHKSVSVEGKERRLVTYKITGKAETWDNWEVVEDKEIAYSYN